MKIKWYTAPSMNVIHEISDLHSPVKTSCEVRHNLADFVNGRLDLYASKYGNYLLMLCDIILN